MQVTETTERVLRTRRGRKALSDDGFIEVTESGGDLWRLHRGNWQHRRIIDVAIGPNQKSVWIKLSEDLQKLG